MPTAMTLSREQPRRRRSTSSAGSAERGRLCCPLLLQVRLSGSEELVVFDIPDVLVHPTSNIRDELAETPMGISLTKFRDSFQEIRTGFAVHDRVSFTLGIRVTSTPGNS